MSPDLQTAIENSINQATGSSSTITRTESISGGCINDVNLIHLSDGDKFFVKTNASAPAKMFACEAAGLTAIANTNTVAVPHVVAFGTTDAGIGFLILEAIESARPSPAFFNSLGKQLATMHRTDQSLAKADRSKAHLPKTNQFGFHIDNFLGATHQVNTWQADWIAFFSEQRIEFQIKLAIDNGYAEPLQSLAGRFKKTLPKILVTAPEPPALIHGDLWSGNFLATVNGDPVLIDPAVYFAHREAEFGMTTLFGGFDQTFYDAYQESWPLQSGWESRVEIYRLYHVLNHLNLFGSSYLAGCVEIMKKFV